MTRMTRILEGYIKHLFFAGTVCTFGGAIGTVIFLSSKHQEDWYVYYIPFKLLGAALGYAWARYWNPGGAVTFHFFSNHKSTEDEIALHNLILRYRNKMLMLLMPIAYLSADLIVGMSRYQAKVSYFDGFFGSIIVAFFIVVGLSTGIKFLSAWWNIKKHWKEEFEN